MEIDNPVDIWMPVARDFETAFPTILDRILADEGVDSVICIYCSYTLPKYDLYDSSGHIREIAGRHPDKPVLCWSYGLDIEGFTREIEKDGTAMVFPSLADAADTLAKLTEYGARCGRPAVVPAPFEAKPEASAILDRAAADDTPYLFTEGLDICATYGLAVAPWRLVASEDELAEKTRDLAYPLCLKIVSPDILHKSDGGGIRLGIADAAALAEGYRALIGDILAQTPDARIDGVLVQQMAPAGKEVMVGMKRDLEFGPCIVFGAGGIYAEIWNDFAFRIAPVDEQEARDMIDETKVSNILKGARGETPCHLPGIVDAIVGLSRLAQAHPQIEEVDINPMIVTPQAAVVVDARIIL
jgi:acyl-CoA synthetase (NDP forming)